MVAIVGRGVQAERDEADSKYTVKSTSLLKTRCVYVRHVVVETALNESGSGMMQQFSSYGTDEHVSA